MLAVDFTLLLGRWHQIFPFTVIAEVVAATNGFVAKIHFIDNAGGSDNAIGFAGILPVFYSAIHIRGAVRELLIYDFPFTLNTFVGVGDAPEIFALLLAFDAARLLPPVVFCTAGTHDGLRR